MPAGDVWLALAALARPVGHTLSAPCVSKSQRLFNPHQGFVERRWEVHLCSWATLSPDAIRVPHLLLMQALGLSAFLNFWTSRRALCICLHASLKGKKETFTLGSVLGYVFFQHWIHSVEHRAISVISPYVSCRLMYVLFCLCVIRSGFRRNLAGAVEEVITQTPCRPGRVLSLTVSPCSSFPPLVLNYRTRLHLCSGDCVDVTVGVSSDVSARHFWLLQIPLFRGRLRNREHGLDVDFGISLINSQSFCTCESVKLGGWWTTEGHL